LESLGSDSKDSNTKKRLNHEPVAVPIGLYRIVAPKVAQAQILVKALRIEGGNYIMTVNRFPSNDCHHEWPRPLGVGHAHYRAAQRMPILKSRIFTAGRKEIG
jgi:hypothetical protein